MESVLILVGVLVGLIILVRSIGKYAYIGGKGEAPKFRVSSKYPKLMPHHRQQTIDI